MLCKSFVHNLFLLTLATSMSHSFSAIAKPAGHLQKTFLPKQSRSKSSRALPGKSFILIAQSDDFLPKIQPIAPLPKVFHKVKLISAPSGVSVDIKHGQKQIPCKPANRTPCVFEAVGYKKNIVLNILIRHQGQVLRYRRTLQGKSLKEDLWLLKIPTIQNPSSILVPRRIPIPPKRRKPPLQKVKQGVPGYVWVIGSILIIGGIGAGVGIALYTSNQVAFRLE